MSFSEQEQAAIRDRALDKILEIQKERKLLHGIQYGSLRDLLSGADTVAAWMMSATIPAPGSDALDITDPVPAEGAAG